MQHPDWPTQCSTQAEKTNSNNPQEQREIWASRVQQNTCLVGNLTTAAVFIKPSTSLKWCLPSRQCWGRHIKVKKIHNHTGWVYSFTAQHLKGMLAAADDVVRAFYKTSTQDLSVSSRGWGEPVGFYRGRGGIDCPLPSRSIFLARDLNTNKQGFGYYTNCFMIGTF